LHSVEYNNFSSSTNYTKNKIKKWITVLGILNVVSCFDQEEEEEEASRKNPLTAFVESGRVGLPLPR
jgi:hypothetical protein